MPDETHVLELLPAYAIGGLDRAEARSVDDHLAACYLCRTELQAFQAVAERLALAVPEKSPPSELKRRLMVRIQDERERRPPPSSSRRFWTPLLPAAGILALLLITILTLSSILLWQRLEHLEVLSGPHGMRAIALRSTEAAPLASAFIIVGEDGLNGALVVDRMPALDPQHEYQLWLTRDGQHTSAGIFSVDESGYRGLRVEAPESLLTYSSARVTIEPAGGSAAPTGPEILSGSLFNP